MTQLPAVYGLFSESALIAFGCGVIVTRTWYFARDRWVAAQHPQAPRLRRHWNTLTMAWALTLLVVGYIGFQSQEARNETVDLTRQVAQCNREFFAVTADRSGWGDETYTWSNTKTEALADFLRAIITPPVNIQELRDNSPNDPRIQQWAIDTTSRYLGIIDNAQAQQDKAIQLRAEHPLPKPTCGG